MLRPAKVSLCISFPIVLLLIALSVANAIEYRVIDTGLIAGRGSNAVTAINNRGDIGAVVNDNGGNRIVVRQADGTLVDYGPCADCVNLSAIDNSGTVVGSFALVSYRPGVWELGQPPVDLGAMIDPYGGGGASAINESGQIVGGFGDRGACLWQKNNSGDWYVTVLANTIPAWGVDAWDINDKGYVVGYVYRASDSAWLPVIWRDATSCTILFEGASGQARAINNQNMILGRLDWEDYYLWDLDRSRQTVLPSGYWRDLNDRNQLVGFSSELQPLLWDNGDLSILPLNKELSTAVATGINNNGWIVGTAFGVSDGSEQVGHIVMWQPVPEPSSIFALLCGLGGGIGGLALGHKRT